MDIEPTVGRSLHYYAQPGSIITNYEPGFPLTCLLAKVNDDSTINVSVIDNLGYAYGIQNVLLIQEDETTPKEGGFCCWMPYQLGRDKTNPESTESKLQEKGLNAPRLTSTDIDAQIVETQYHIFDNTQLTVCCLILRNGYTVTGESACVSPENFDVKIGKEIAFKNARDKIWTLEGYILQEKLFGTRLECNGCS